MRQERSPENIDKEEIGVNETDEGADHMAEDILFDDEFNKAQEPGAVSDPGSPTAKEIATHNIPHLLHRARSTDRLHWASKESDEHAVPEFSFDNAFLWSKGEEERQAVQVGRDRRTGMRFAHLVPNAVEMLQDSDPLGYGRVMLKCDNESDLVSVQKEVVCLRATGTIIENSPAGDSKANGMAERTVWSFGEQMRAIHAVLQDRSQVQVPGNCRLWFLFPRQSFIHCVSSADLLDMRAL